MALRHRLPCLNRTLASSRCPDVLNASGVAVTGVTQGVQTYLPTGVGMDGMVDQIPRQNALVCFEALAPNFVLEFRGFDLLSAVSFFKREVRRRK